MYIMGKERRLAREQVYPVLLRGSCSVHQREGCAHRYPSSVAYTLVGREASIEETRGARVDRFRTRSYEEREKAT